jgi:hypothetical protein
LHYKIEENERSGVILIKISSEFSGPSDELFISKYEDEWYIIEYYKMTPFQLRTIFYKCDQFDGLLKCLDGIEFSI